jgi:lon-related putative ATP-dependent protease
VRDRRFDLSAIFPHLRRHRLHFEEAVHVFLACASQPLLPAKDAVLIDLEVQRGACQMIGIKELPAEMLYTICRPEDLSFETTAELKTGVQIPGQARAAEAVRFGIGIEREGYNIFALGPAGSGKHFVVEHFLRERASTRPIPPDLCYVNNFVEPNKPTLLTIPSGLGVTLKKDLKEFVEEVMTALPAIFESEEYQAKANAIRQSVQTGEELSQLHHRAKEKGVAMLHTPAGVVFAPMKGGAVLGPEEFAKLEEGEQKRLAAAIEELEQQLATIVRQAPRWEREVRSKIRELNREMTVLAVGHLLDELRQKYADHPHVVTYLDSVQNDVVEHARQFIASDGTPPPGIAEVLRGTPVARRYDVNVLVDHSAEAHAPVVYEDHPSYDNLLGRIEHISEMGTLVTDFNLIRPGAFHKANGGYLILDARKLLLSPYSWEALKRVLQSRQIRIESIGQALGLISTVSLTPEPVPLDVKVVLLGDRFIYYLLCRYDPDFLELFKVAADFDDVFERTRESQQIYANLIASIAAREKMRHFDKTAVIRLVEHSSRMAGDAEKLSAQVSHVADLLREADYYAAQAGRAIVTRSDVQCAIDAYVRRSDRVRERLQEATLRKTIYIDTEGAKVGQVNGLSVIELNGFMFGHPSRITARIRLGKGEVINIEREVELSGPIHSKGVLILSGFLAGRYASEYPLSLSASLVFEQSYSGVEGDSASSTELYALLSAIADLPIKQSLSVTGSVNQLGEVQPIGAVNEKIEGFFDLCRAKGLTGDQGALIPAANVKNLMLRQDVVDAVSRGEFHIYPVETIDQGIELLTGIEAGERDEAGDYPYGTVNHRIQRRLREMAKKQIELAQATLKGFHDD